VLPAGVKFCLARRFFEKKPSLTGCVAFEDTRCFEIPVLSTCRSFYPPHEVKSSLPALKPMPLASANIPKPHSAPDPNPRYGGVAIGLHWLIAIAIIGSSSLGFYMSDLPLSPQKLKSYSWHKWAGVTIFLCVLFRLVWPRWSLQTPPLMATQTPPGRTVEIVMQLAVVDRCIETQRVGDFDYVTA